MLTSGLASPDMSAHAAGCLSSRDARAAVQSGQALPLSKMLGRIRSTAGGEILPPPKLCDRGGRLVYMVNVLSPGGQVKKLTVDASNGSILGN
ncbi:MAG: PepSY domain-containing protein [Hyphomicrobiales bacterium]|nr:PepSY domain-containing protein [Hyphomicrobiales bacterium]